MKTSSVRFHLAIVLITLIVLPFQNCSLYKSEGRKFLEENGEELLVETVSGSAVMEKIKSGCSPLVSPEAAKRILESSSIESTLSFEPTENKYVCILTDDSSEPQTTVCSVSPSQYNLLAARDQTALPDPHPKGELPGGSFGFVTKLDSGTVHLHFVGVANISTEVIHCLMSFDSEDQYQQKTQKALQRVSTLVHEIASNL